MAKNASIDSACCLVLSEAKDLLVQIVGHFQEADSSLARNEAPNSH